MTLRQVVLTLRLLANNWAGADRTYGANPSKRVVTLRELINEYENLTDDDQLPELITQLDDLANTWEQADQLHMGRTGGRVNQLRELLEEVQPSDG